MAYAIMGELLAATVRMSIFLAALYVAWFRVKDAGSSRSMREQ